MSAFLGRRVLISGGAGAFGKKMVAYALRNGAAKVIVFSRDEMKHSQSRRDFAEFSSRIDYRIGDVLDSADLDSAMANADIVLHAAAMKHLPECEANAWASTKVNVLGTQNVISAFKRSAATDLVFLSTDKAPYPSTVYGAQKLIGEKLVLETQRDLVGKRRVHVLRYSNVIDSTGAAFLLFRNMLTQGKTITVNGRSTCRGFVKQDQVIATVEKVLTEGLGGDTVVLKPLVIRIGDLAEVMHKKIGRGEVVVKEEMGFSGEKESASLVMKEEVGFVYNVSTYEGTKLIWLNPAKKGSPAQREIPANGLTLDDCPTLDQSMIEEFIEPLMKETV